MSGIVIPFHEFVCQMLEYTSVRGLLAHTSKDSPLQPCPAFHISIASANWTLLLELPVLAKLSSFSLFLALYTWDKLQR